jgi:transposase
MLKFGVFILVSTLDLDIKDILSTYYTRQSVEQFFNYINKEIDILPLPTYSEETFTGHFLISFIATVALTAINNELRKYSLTFDKSLESLKRFNCRIYKNKIIPDVSTKNVNDVLKALKIKIPSVINDGLAKSPKFKNPN